MARFQRAEKHWVEAQKRYERAYGGRQTSQLRESLRAVIASDLGPLKAAPVESQAAPQRQPQRARAERAEPRYQSPQYFGDTPSIMREER